MAHLQYIEDADGDLIDLEYFCSDSCARNGATNYQGWSGIHELEFTEWCKSCGVVIGGTDSDPQCDHLYPIVVNLIGVPVDEHCEHGNLVRSSLGL